MEYCVRQLSISNPMTCQRSTQILLSLVAVCWRLCNTSRQHACRRETSTSRQASPRMTTRFPVLIVALAISLIAKLASPFPSDSSFFRGRRRGVVACDCLGTTASHREAIVTHLGANSPNGKDGTQRSSPLAESSMHYESRRRLVHRALTLVAVAGSLSAPISSARADTSAGVTVQRAVGSGEAKCRTQGNCLEVGELDGAVGWSWGGKDRCDPRDVNCGADGRVRSSPLVGQPVPDAAAAAASITHIAAIQLDVGRDETGVLSDRSWFLLVVVFIFLINFLL
jgi:hypothetical protein